mmetsp:Transcript_22625/g.67880  ORF Transcript_22625/g.67880 Transcript_22625/m.67880 type:complete len:371 (+) Transcript_22625:409-1521(+)
MTPAELWMSSRRAFMVTIGRPAAASTISARRGTMELPTMDWGAMSRKTSSFLSTDWAFMAPKRIMSSSPPTSWPPQSMSSRSFRTPFSDSGMPAKMPSPMGACTQMRTRRPVPSMMRNARLRTSSSSVPTRYVSISTSSSGGLTFTFSVGGASGSPSASSTAAMQASAMWLRANFDAGTLFSHKLSGSAPASPRPPGNSASSSSAAARERPSLQAACIKRRCAVAPSIADPAFSFASMSVQAASAVSSVVSKLRPRPPSRRLTEQRNLRPFASSDSSTTDSSTADPPVRAFACFICTPSSVCALTSSSSSSGAFSVTNASTDAFSCTLRAGRLATKPFATAHNTAANAKLGMGSFAPRGGPWPPQHFRTT